MHTLMRAKVDNLFIVMFVKFSKVIARELGVGTLYWNKWQNFIKITIV